MIPVFPGKSMCNSGRFGSEDSVTYKCVGKTPQIFAIAGGKGGVGKTLVATMLGICLAGFQRKTLVVDLDFSGSNVHGYLDLPDLRRSLNSFLNGRTRSLHEVVQPTFWDNLGAITLDSQTGSLNPSQTIQEFFKQLRCLDVDYIILDVGNPTLNFAFDVFAAADERVVVTTNDRLSLTNTFLMIRTALIHRLKKAWYDFPALLTALDNCALLMDGIPPKSLKDVLASLPFRTKKLVSLLSTYCQTFAPKILLNATDDFDDLSGIISFEILIRCLFNMNLEYWGQLRHDGTIQRATRQNRPDLWFHPFGKMSTDIIKMVTRHIIGSEYFKSGTMNNMNSSWSIAQTLNGKTFRCTDRCFLWNRCAMQCAGKPCKKIIENALLKAG